MTREEMTREKAVDIFKCLAYHNLRPSEEEISDAIQTLQTEPCEDAIKREAVLNTLDEMDAVLDENRTVESYKELLKACYKELLPVKPKARWIPVSERKPLCEEEVMIRALRKTFGGKREIIITTAMYEDGTIRDCDSKWRWEEIDWAGWDEEEDCGIIPEGWWEYRHYNPDDVYNNKIDDEVLAWMPLPKDYTESEVEE